MTRLQRFPPLYVDVEELLRSNYSASSFRHIPLSRTPPPPHFLSASEMWVNEAPPSSAVSSTYTACLIRPRDGQEAGGGAGETGSAGNIKAVCVRVCVEEFS